MTSLAFMSWAADAAGAASSRARQMDLRIRFPPDGALSRTSDARPMLSSGPKPGRMIGAVRRGGGPRFFLFAGPGEEGRETRTDLFRPLDDEVVAEILEDV